MSFVCLTPWQSHRCFVWPAAWLSSELLFAKENGKPVSDAPAAGLWCYLLQRRWVTM